MPQTLDVISVNLWNILISLANLTILFWLVKKFLFAPVKRMFAARQAAIDHQYAAAEAAKAEAEAHKEAWQSKMASAEDEAKSIVKEAKESADHRAEQIVREADARAEQIVARAETEAELTRKRAEDGIKKEIVEVSAALAEKLLEREVHEEDHRAMIDAFIEQMGDDHDTDR